MRYPKFRSQHLFVGSGVIEAGCKTVIGSRLKQSGMFWTVRGANAILALRCCHLNGRFEDYWEARGRLITFFHFYVAHPGWKQRGQSGRWISDLVPNLLRARTTSGLSTPWLPSRTSMDRRRSCRTAVSSCPDTQMGAWVSYGLGA